LLERLTIDDFAPLVGQPFATEGPDGPERWTLVEAIRLGMAPIAKDARAPFALRFLPDVARRVPQGMVSLTMPSGEELGIFVVPIGLTSAGHSQLEAVFT
jgi:hypothetical protein